LSSSVLLNGTLSCIELNIYDILQHLFTLFRLRCSTFIACFRVGFAFLWTVYYLANKLTLALYTSPLCMIMLFIDSWCRCPCSWDECYTL